jgi:hypothetical protein
MLRPEPLNFLAHVPLHHRIKDLQEIESPLQHLAAGVIAH